MNVDEAISLLVDHAAKLDSEFAEVKAGLSLTVTKKEFAELRSSMLGYA